MEWLWHYGIFNGKENYFVFVKVLYLICEILLKVSCFAVDQGKSFTCRDFVKAKMIP